MWGVNSPSADSQAPTLDVGLVVSPQLSDAVRQAAGADLEADLTERYGQVRWNVVTVVDRLADPSVDALDFTEIARDRMLDEDWDLVVALTDIPLRNGRRQVRTQYSAVHGVGVAVMPALGVVQVRAKVRRACLTLVEEILDFDADDSGEDVVRRARERSDDVEIAPGQNPVQFAARVLGGNLRVLLGLVRANRPLTLTLRLSRLIAATAGAGALLLLTSDIWVLAVSYGPVRLGALAVGAVLAVTVSLVVGAGLWERPRRRGEREQVMLFNLATVCTVLLGVATFYLLVCVLAVGGAWFLLTGDGFRTLAGESLTTERLLHVAWMVASLATIGGAVGAGLEEDDLVRSAAYTHETDEPTDEDA